MEELFTKLPAQYVAYATAAWVLVQSLGRAYSAIRKGGGLKGIWDGLIYGTNTPKNEKTTASDSTPARPDGV